MNWLLKRVLIALAAFLAVFVILMIVAIFAPTEEVGDEGFDQPGSSPGQNFRHLTKIMGTAYSQFGRPDVAS